MYLRGWTANQGARAVTAGEVVVLDEAARAAVAICDRLERLAAAGGALTVLLGLAEDRRDFVLLLRDTVDMSPGDGPDRVARAELALAELGDIAAAAVEQYRELSRRHLSHERRRCNAGPRLSRRR